jgi:hypothetical protein
MTSSRGRTDDGGCGDRDPRGSGDSGRLVKERDNDRLIGCAAGGWHPSRVMSSKSSEHFAALLGWCASWRVDSPMSSLNDSVPP